MHNVFISYSSYNTKRVIKVCNYLEQRSIKCWYAPRDINPGDEWATSIHDAIDHCGILILFLSEDSNESMQVQKEILLAKEYEKKIIVYEIEKVDELKLLNRAHDVSLWINRVRMSKKDVKQLQGEICKICSIERIERSGVYWDLLKKRGKLLLRICIGIVALVIVSVIVSQFHRIVEVFKYGLN